jgi:hypothetical protein
MEVGRLKNKRCPVCGSWAPSRTDEWCRNCEYALAVTSRKVSSSDVGSNVALRSQISFHFEGDADNGDHFFSIPEAANQFNDFVNGEDDPMDGAESSLPTCSSSECEEKVTGDGDYCSDCKSAINNPP